jgi:hypothetical protein
MLSIVTALTGTCLKPSLLLENPVTPKRSTWHLVPNSLIGSVKLVQHLLFDLMNALLKM